MFTKPQQRVRVTARNYEGSKPGKSVTVTVYGTDADAVITRLLGSARDAKTRGKKKSA